MRLPFIRTAAIAVTLGCLSLAACQTTPATPPPPAPVAVCIPLGNVSPAQQKAASETLKGLTKAQQDALAPIFTDWIAMRDADRACIAGSSSITTESGHPLP